MKNIGTLQVSNSLEKMISENMLVHKEIPMAFYLDNKGITWGMHHHTDNKIQDLTKWTNKVGAELTVLGMEGSRVVIEITDPIALQLEKHLS